MKVLVACEESQVVTIAMRKLGIKAWSCDIEPCSGGHQKWHLQQDVSPLLEDDWDLIIAFPPCTHLSVSGARYFKEKIADGRQQAGIDFFMMFANNHNPKIAIENPIGIMSTKFRKPDQIIQPWQFGHPESKATCLWLKGLPKLKPTRTLPLPASGRWENQTASGQNKLGPSPERAKLRSKTYQGIAKAIATQYIASIKSEKQNG